MDIVILDFRILAGDKPLKAFVDVRLGDITMRDFRVMQDQGKPYIKVPFVTYKDKKGEIRFRPIIELPATVRGQVETVILSEYYSRMAEVERGQGSR